MTEEARRCEGCGYHHPVGVGTDVCDACGQRLGLKTYGPLKLQTVFTRRRERISSDEEERRKAGFELEVSYRFHDHDDRAGRVDVETKQGNNPLVKLVYGDSATIRIANIGRRRRKNPRLVEPADLGQRPQDEVVDGADLPFVTHALCR